MKNIYLPSANANIMEVVSSADGWCVLYSGPHAERVIRLFGTGILPTAYTLATARDYVIGQLQALNPGVYIY